MSCLQLCFVDDDSDITPITAAVFFMAKTMNENSYNKKVFKSKRNPPLADRCMGYVVNKFEQGQGAGAGRDTGPEVNKFERVTVFTWGIPCEQTDRDEQNITSLTPLWAVQ